MKPNRAFNFRLDVADEDGSNMVMDEILDFLMQSILHTPNIIFNKSAILSS